MNGPHIGLTTNTSKVARSDHADRGTGVIKWFDGGEGGRGRGVEGHSDPFRGPKERNKLTCIPISAKSVESEITAGAKGGEKSGERARGAAAVIQNHAFPFKDGGGGGTSAGGGPSAAPMEPAWPPAGGGVFAPRP